MVLGSKGIRYLNFKFFCFCSPRFHSDSIQEIVTETKQSWRVVILIGSIWDWYIYLHEYLFFYGFHVGKYTMPYMDGMGYC